MPDLPVYCISGLGADQRIFSHIDIPGVRLIYLPWLIPHPHEPIEAYALRMKAGITGDSPVLIGVSFGGMMALEIAKYYPAAKIVLVSSIGNRWSMPKWMKVCGRLRLNRIIPVRVGKGVRWLENYCLGIETEEDARLVDSFKGAIDQGYLSWAIDKILNWKNEWRPSSFFHLHGSRDRMFPLQRVDATHIVQGAGHFMVNNRAEQVNRLLTEIIISP